MEEEEARGGNGAGAAAPSAAEAPEPDNAGADASDDAGAGGARMSKKRQRMEQLIQKSMGMVLKAFEQEAVPTGRSQHASSTRVASTATSGTVASGNAVDTGECEAAPPIDDDLGGGGDDPNTSHQQQRPVVVRRKQCWTQEEDAKLCGLVEQHGLSQWALIAAHFPKRDRKRCRERFVNHLDPQLKQHEWSRQEETQLMDLQREIGSHWAKIARKLPGRSPEDVKNRFLASAAKQLADNPVAQSQSSSSPTTDKELPVVTRASPKRWSTTETETLRALVQTRGATNWFFLASQLPGRTDLQCMQQWYQVLDPAIVKGKGTWTAQEDATLLSKYQELGPKWTQDPWTLEEEAKLVQACKKHATQWFQIARELPGRSENAIKNRWHTITRRKILQASNNDNPSDA